MLSSSVLLNILITSQLVLFGVNCSYFVTDRYVSVYTTPQTWESALETCKSNRMSLVTIKSSAENGELASIMKQNNMTYSWIGASDLRQEGNWTWADGSEVTQAFWYPGQPDNLGKRQHCVLLSHFWDEVMNWADWLCDDKFQFICETPTLV